MLVRGGQPVEHIGESFRMHQAVFIDGAQKSFRGKAVRFGGEWEKASVESVVDQVAESLHVVADFVKRWPITGLIGGKATVHRIDSKREKLVERRCARFHGKQLGAKNVPVEGFQMANVKNDAIAFGDRPFVERIFANNLEEAVGVGSRFHNGVAKLVDRGEFALRCHGSCLREGRDSPTRNQMREKTLLADGIELKMCLRYGHGSPCKGREGREEKR